MVLLSIRYSAVYCPTATKFEVRAGEHGRSVFRATQRVHILLKESCSSFVCKSLKFDSNSRCATVLGTSTRLSVVVLFTALPHSVHNLQVDVRIFVWLTALLSKSSCRKNGGGSQQVHKQRTVVDILPSTHEPDFRHLGSACEDQHDFRPVRQNPEAVPEPAQANFPHICFCHWYTKGGEDELASLYQEVSQARKPAACKARTWATMSPGLHAAYALQASSERLARMQICPHPFHSDKHCCYDAPAGGMA